jgi:hypothetical protein
MPAKLGGTGESYRPFYYIAARLLGGAFPMTLLILPAALAFYTDEISPEKRNAVIYQISMSLAVLLFFSIASVKRDDYILPALPGIAILCASVFTLAARGLASKLRDVVVAMLVLVPPIALFVHTVFLLPAIKLQSSDALYYSAIATRELVGPFYSGVPIVWFVAVVMLVFGFLRKRAIVGGFVFGLVSLCMCLCWTSILRPSVAEMRSVKSFVPTIVDYVKADQLCIPAGINYELSYYYGAAVPDISNPRCSYLIATPRDLDAMTPEYRAQLKLIEKSFLIGGSGPPALFEISPEAAK